MQLKHVKIFALESNLSSFPSYVICAAEHINDSDIRGESFLLYITKGIKARLVAMEIVISNNLSDPAFFSDINEDFVIEECLNQGKLNMLDVSKNKMTYDYRPAIKNVFEVDITYLLHGDFGRENIKSKLQLIGEMTQIEAIKQYINMLNKYPHASFTPMKLPNVEI